MNTGSPTSAMPLSDLLVEQEIIGTSSQVDIADITVSGLCADSRSIRSGELYVALAGENVHGLDFESQAIAAGASAILVDAKDSRAAAQEQSLPVVKVSGLAQQLGTIASRFHGYPSRQLTVCGITGTDGKTSVSQFVVKALQALGHKAGYIGTIGWGLHDPANDSANDSLSANPLTTPDPVTLQAMIAKLYSAGAEFVVLEVSSHALVQGRVNGVEFDVAALTNLGRDHLDYHGSVENYRAAKELLFKWPQLSAIVVNGDDEFGQLLAAEALENPSGPRLCRYGVHDLNGVRHELHVDSITAGPDGLSFDVHCDSKNYHVNTTLIGDFNVQNLLACIGVLQSFGIAMEKIVPVLAELRPVTGRMELFSDSRFASVVVDYAHTPQALESALKALRHHCKGELWVVFGCGGDRDNGKRALMGNAAATLADHVIVTNDNPRTEDPSRIFEHILGGIDDRSRVVVIESREQAIQQALESAGENDWVLIAGKGHEDYQLVGDQVLEFSDREVVTRIQRGTGS